MKTKERVTKSLAGAHVACQRLLCAGGASRSDCTTRPDLSLRDIADPIHRGASLWEPAEQSENVYENKGW